MQTQEGLPGDYGFDKGEVFEIVVGKVPWSLYESPQEIYIACYASDPGTFLENFESESALRCCFDTPYEPDRSNAGPDARMRVEKGTERLESFEGEQYDGYMPDACVLSQYSHFAAYADDGPVGAQFAWMGDGERQDTNGDLSGQVFESE